MEKYTFPRTIQRGPLKGQTFDTEGAYQRAYKLWKSGQEVPSVSGLRGDLCVRVIDSYEELRAIGVGRAQAVRVLQRVFGA